MATLIATLGNHCSYRHLSKGLGTEKTILTMKLINMAWVDVLAKAHWAHQSIMHLRWNWGWQEPTVLEYVIIATGTYQDVGVELFLQKYPGTFQKAKSLEALNWIDSIETAVIWRTQWALRGEEGILRQITTIKAAAALCLELIWHFSIIAFDPGPNNNKGQGRSLENGVPYFSQGSPLDWENGAQKTSLTTMPWAAIPDQWQTNRKPYKLKSWNHIHLSTKSPLYISGWAHGRRNHYVPLSIYTTGKYLDS